MKRHPSLQSLSRDHHAVLSLANRLQRDPNDQRLREFLDLWSRDLEAHFEEEERLLAKLVKPADGERLLREHARIRQFATAAARGMFDLSDVVRLGDILRTHVRWEERHLFPYIEQNASEAELSEIGRSTGPGPIRPLQTEFLSLS